MTEEYDASKPPEWHRVNNRYTSQEPAIPYKPNAVSSGLFDDLEQRLRKAEEWAATVKHHGDQIDGLLGDIERNRKLVARIEELENAMEMISPVGFAKDRAWARATDARIKELEERLNTKIAAITEALDLQSHRIDNVNKMGGARENELAERISALGDRVERIEQANLQKWKEQDKREQSYPCPYCTHMALRIPAEATTYFLNHHSLEDCAHRMRMLEIEKEVYAKRDSSNG